MKEKSLSAGIFFALLAAALYAINSPFSKILLEYMPSTLMAGFLYLGAGIGMCGIIVLRKFKKSKPAETKLAKGDLPYTVAMILLDIAAPICLLFGLRSTTAANASLLNIFQRSVADRAVEGHFFGNGFHYHRPLYRRTDHRTLERFCRSRRRVCGVWAEHIFLCVCAALARRRTHERLLCRSALHRDRFIPHRISRNAAVYILYRARFHGGRRVAVFGR